VRGDDRRAGEKSPHVGGRTLLPGLRAQRHEVRVERPVGAEERFDAHRRRDVGRAEHEPRVRQREQEHAEHPVGAVHEREAFLGVEVERREPRSLRHRRTLEPVAAGVDRHPFADQAQRRVGQRRQVAAAPEGPVLRHDGSHAGVEQGRQRGGDLEPSAGAAHGQGPQAQQHHRPDDLGLDRRAEAGRVRTDERSLEAVAVPGRDEHGCQGTEPGRHAVHGRAGGGGRLDDGARPRDRLARPVSEPYRRVAAGDGDHLGGGEARPVDDDGGGLGRHRRGP
jgi:hypothetical protein